MNTIYVDILKVIQKGDGGAITTQEAVDNFPDCQILDKLLKLEEAGYIYFYPSFKRWGMNQKSVEALEFLEFLEGDTNELLELLSENKHLIMVGLIVLAAVSIPQILVG